MQQKYKPARQRINDFISHCEMSGLSYTIDVDVTLAPDLSYAFAKARVKMGNDEVCAHKLFYQKEAVGGQKTLRSQRAQKQSP